MVTPSGPPDLGSAPQKNGLIEAAFPIQQRPTAERHLDKNAVLQGQHKDE
jgi:hypothetical protein